MPALPFPLAYVSMRDLRPGDLTAQYEVLEEPVIEGGELRLLVRPFRGDHESEYITGDPQELIRVTNVEKD